MRIDATDAGIRHYEGLVRRTAQMTAPLVEDDLDDVAQMLRIKVWRALVVYDPSKSAMTRDRYVFMLLRNLVKDIVKKKRRGDVSIEQLTTSEGDNGRLDTSDSFDERYLSSTEEEVYGQVVEGTPLIPSTLTDLEERVLCLLYRDFKQAEVARSLGVEKRVVERCVSALRSKMADWQPSAPVDIKQLQSALGGEPCSARPTA